MAMLRRTCSSLSRRLRGAVLDRRGVAAVEFAMILPLLLLLYVGTADLSRGVMSIRKVDLLSRTISDLVAQQSNASAMPSSTISLIFTTASAIMVPFSTNNLTLTVSAVDIKAVSNVCCQVLVRWSYTQGGTLRSCGTALTQTDDGAKPLPTNFPKSIVNANVAANYGYLGGQASYVIVTDVNYKYIPIFQQAVAWFTPGFQKTTYMVPRSTAGPLLLQTPVNAATGQSGTVCSPAPS